MGTTQGAWAWSQASDNCAGVAPLRTPHSCSIAINGMLAVMFSGVCRGRFARKSPSANTVPALMVPVVNP